MLSSDTKQPNIGCKQTQVGLTNVGQRNACNHYAATGVTLLLRLVCRHTTIVFGT